MDSPSAARAERSHRKEDDWRRFRRRLGLESAHSSIKLISEDASLPHQSQERTAPDVHTLTMLQKMAMHASS